MLAARPFSTREALFEAAARIWQRLGPDDYLEAFAHHPEIGANLQELPPSLAGTSDLARTEQAGAAAASAETRHALQAGNALYRARFGYAFIICASGKTAEQMQAALEARLTHSAELEIGIAAAEQARITRLRLERLEPLDP
jgi:2-oxo-4-hydroxy-4-carboxy-5-ureidoimidazoline decarboxylase